MIGAFFKIPLNQIIGNVGMGYFGTAYTIYNPIFSLATAGFPVAISRLVSEACARGQYREARRVHHLSIPIFLALGTLSCLVMAFGARPYLEYANRSDMNALPAVYVLAPAVLFSSAGGDLPRLLRGPAQYVRRRRSLRLWRRCSSCF